MLILPTITTTDDKYKKKIEEAELLRLKKVNLFLTGLDSEQRKEIYRLVEKADIKEIPFVHLRTDMEVGD